MAEDVVGKALREGEQQLQAAIRHMPQIIAGTPDIRCGTCRFRFPKHGPQHDAGMGICRRYRGSIVLYTRGHSDACWHHQRAAVTRAASEDKT